MLPDLDLVILAVAFRSEASFGLPRLYINLDDRHPQDTADIAAFRRTGWNFHRESDVNWTNLRAECHDRAAVEVGLLARRGNRPGLVIIRNSLVVAFVRQPDVDRLNLKYTGVRKLTFGENLYEIELGLPVTDEMLTFIDTEISILLKEEPGVRWAEPVVVYHVAEPATTVDRRPGKTTPKAGSSAKALSGSSKQWHWEKIALRAAWKAAGAKRGDGTLVAVIDKGFHENIKFRSKIDQRAHLDEKGNDIFSPGAGLPVRPHGTMCAGLVAADTGNGVHGAAPGCRLMLVALGDTIDSTGMAAALKLCADRKADVISCCVGPSDESWDRLNTLLAAVDDVQKHGRNGLGTLIVWAVANADRKIQSATLVSYLPLICVAPSYENDLRVTASEYGLGLDLLAPGAGVRVLWWDPEYGPNVIPTGGASVAAPCVAGVAAVVLSYKNKLALSDLMDVIAEKSCDPYVPMKKWEEQRGWGRLNAKRAIEEASKFP